MTAPNWNELRAEGRVVVDAPARKLAIYPASGGHVILLSVDNGKATYTEIQPHEFDAAMSALAQAMLEGEGIHRELVACYETQMAIEKAQGC